MNNHNLLRIGITHGDYNGVGYEVIIKSLSDNRILEIFTPVIFGSAKAFDYYTSQTGVTGLDLNVIKNAADAVDGKINLVNVVPANEVNIEPGAATAASGAAALCALDAAVEAVNDGAVDALVTAPIDKHAIQSDKFNFAGHTEYLQAATNADNSLMILFNTDMRVALVTTHLPVSQISASITGETILSKIKAFDASLRADFGIVKPRIAVLALNPHAGDGGLLGREETEIIIPAIEQAQNANISCFGPYSADGFFGARLYRKFDGILAMYHDQGLAPFKTVAMDSGVNFTAGLPIVRTSPDHGTGADIAGRGIASADSMRAAIYAAIDICRERTRHSERTANPLKRLYVDRSKDNVVLDLK